MKKIKILLYFIFLTFCMVKSSYGKENYFSQGEKLFKQNKLVESKFKFEKDIVFNPKS